MAATTFPVGCHDLHPQMSMNFQMNRWFGPDGKQAWAANLKGSTVSVIDIASRKQINQIAVG